MVLVSVVVLAVIYLGHLKNCNIVDDCAGAGPEANTWITSSSSVSSMEQDIDEEIASLQLVINDLESEIVAMQRHFDVDLRVAGDHLHNAVCIPPLDYQFAQRFTD